MRCKNLIKKVKGGVMVFVAILLPMFLGFTCLTIDSWNLYLIRNQMQVAVDAAALAGATSMNTVAIGVSATAITAATTLTSLNGFTNGSNNVTVTVSIPPGDPYGTSPSYKSNSNYVRVQMSKVVSLYFGSIISIPTVTLSVNAVAGPSGGSASIIVLSTSASGAINLSGGGTITAVSGSIAVNSSSSSAVILTGGTKITASTVNIVGGDSIAGGCSIVGTVNTGAAATANPFSSITLPTPSSCTATNYYIGNADTATLSPGTYCGGMSIQGSASVTLNPGTYILDGGGLAVANNASLTGTGVTFYNTGTATGTTAYGSLSIAGYGIVKLTAPTSGTYQGMLFMQNPSNTQTAYFSNGGVGYLQGNIYIPNGALSFAGAGTLSEPLGIIACLTISSIGGAVLETSTQYGGGTGGGIALYE